LSAALPARRRRVWRKTVKRGDGACPPLEENGAWPLRLSADFLAGFWVENETQQKYQIHNHRHTGSPILRFIFKIDKRLINKLKQRKEARKFAKTKITDSPSRWLSGPFHRFILIFRKSKLMKITITVRRYIGLSGYRA